MQIIFTGITTVMMFLAFLFMIHFLNNRLELGLMTKNRIIVEKSIWIAGACSAGVWCYWFAARSMSIYIPYCVQIFVTILCMSLLAITDYKRHTIPNAILKVMLLVWAVIEGIAILLDMGTGLNLLFYSILGGAVGGISFLICYILAKGQLGAGDVKLMFVLGLFLTSQRIMGSMIYGITICCIYSVIQLLRKKIGMKDGVPLAPFLYIGTLITLMIL